MINVIKKNVLSLALLFCLTPIGGALAQGQPKSAPIDAAGRHAVIESLAQQLKAKYVFPDVAKRLSASLIAKDTAGDYYAAADTQAFAEVLSKDLRELGKDSHFVIHFAPGVEPRPSSVTPSKDELEQMRQEIEYFGFGIQHVERLQGNVGYLEVRNFGPTDMVGAAFTAAMHLLSGTDALILDLRRNGGGEPESVAYLLSHFFASGDDRHLNDIYTRPGDTTRQYWTLPAVGVRYTKPVYVLTSSRTFSGGEECAYDLQTQKRATLVGETTGGGANPGDDFALGHGFVAFIPTGRSINPITHTNWEHVGVKPDIAVPAVDALKTAHAAILKTLITEKKDPEEIDDLKHILEQVESGVAEKPVYSVRR